MLVLGFLAMPGCQTFKSTFSKAPKLPKLTDMKLPSPGNLAFWKKETDSVPPPPPSRHLSPSLTDSTSGMLSQNKSEAPSTSEPSSIDIDEYRRKIDQMKDGIAATQNKLDFGSNKPSRTPYGSEEEVSFGGNASNAFKSDFKSDLKEATGNSLDRGFAAAKNKTDNLLSDAQKQFNNAVADVKKPTGSNDFRSPADILSTKPSNEFKAALAKSNTQLNSKLGSLNTQLNNKLNGQQNKGTFNPSLAKVNQSLYDMNGKLTTGAAEAAKSIGGSVEAARERFSNALGTVSDRAIEAAKTSKEFGGGIKDKIVAAASELKPPLRGGDNSFKPAFTQAADPVKAEAQNLLNKAKERVAGLGTGFDFPSSANSSSQPANGSNFAASTPAAAQTQPSQSGGTFGGGDFGSSTGTFNRTRVASVTPVNPKRTQGQPNFESSLTKAWNNGTKQSQLKPIEIGARSTTPGNTLRTASLKSNDFAASSAATIPAAFDQGRNAMTSHVSEIDIPTKILSGTSSYAPGSVNKVR